MSEKVIQETPISPGIGFGRPCFYQTESLPTSGETNLPENHAPPILDAFNRLGEHLGSLVKHAEYCHDRDSADLFSAHRMICEELQHDVLQLIDQEQESAVEAIEKCFGYYSDYFDSLDDGYLSERANDFSELKQLLLDLLSNSKVSLQCRGFRGCRIGECELKNAHIFVCDELSSSVAIRIRKYTRGIITQKCGMNSHAAVITRSLDIPVVSGVKEPLELISHKDNVLIDGNKGQIIINPESTTLEKYGNRINRLNKSLGVVEPLSQFRVMADIDRCHEVNNAIRVKADGIGMYRTEFEMLARGHILSVQEQLESYRYVLRQMLGKPVYIRLFDLGSDKSAPWLEMEKEVNPALGCRGARLLLARPELLASQARAIAYASLSAPVNVIYPMVSGKNEYLQLKNLFMTAISEIDNTQIRHGIMFEVPSACMNADDLYEVIEFGRIGSNDLIQYLHARDRTSDSFDYQDLASDPAIWNLIAIVAGAAEKAGKPLELCGSVADTARFVPQLIKFGITTISTRTENIATLRNTAGRFLNTIKNCPPSVTHIHST